MKAVNITASERGDKNGRASLDKYWRFKSSQETDAEGESAARS